MRALFPDNDDLLGERQFSRLHSIVLGLTPGTLLAEPGVNINAIDNMGRTALSWAVQRQDHTATKLLLRNKADPNIASLSGNTPAAFAASRHNSIGLRLLLEAGASITQRSRNGHSCLHFASVHATLCDTVEVLIAAGCDVHEKDCVGATALSIAAQASGTAILCALISHGSNINSTDFEGDCPLSCALVTRKDENLRLLLNYGADYTVINNYGSTVLHHAALSGGLITLEILRSAKLSRIDPNAKDKKGKTALQLAQERYAKPEGFVHLFLTLLFEIRSRDDAIAANGGGRQDAEGVEAHGLSETPEAGGGGNIHREGSSETNSADVGRGAGAVEPRRDDDENDGESGEAFFDAQERQ